MSDPEHTPLEPEQNSFPSGAPDFAPATWASTTSSDRPAELFQSWSHTEIAPSKRIPHFGHLCLLTAFAGIGFVCASVIMLVALHFHLFGAKNLTDVGTNVHYILGFEAILYLVAFFLALVIFPLFWNKSFFAGIQWQGAKALRLGWWLPSIAVGCFALAALDEVLLPGPAHAPIEDIFRSPGAAWLMFGFGVVFAPFFEEMAFRGFLLPALATAWDWAIEKSTGKPARPLDANGHPQWSFFAMVIASIFTTLPFALVHADQQGHSLGPFILLIVVSLILCAVRLVTRSLAASTLVHACYNFLLFFLMLIGTGGFRHLEKL
ncbi:MAG: CPBP family intramembrane glutamic endopeptidase [Terracidiphilus sp.]|jgi:membrane protease YdiL (CAAX protease family)